MPVVNRHSSSCSSPPPSSSSSMMWSVMHSQQQQPFYHSDASMMMEEDPADPAAPRLSQDEQIKAYEAELANEARRTAEVERYEQQQRQFEEEYRIQEWQQLLLLQQQQQQTFLPAAPRRKEVSFADSALLFSSDRTPEEIHRMWYTKDELAHFKDQRKAVVKALKKSHFDVPAVERKGYCLRGYEAYFSLDINKAMKDARSLVISLVLTEQDRQRALQQRDPEAIRFAGAAVSQWATDNARQLGENDEAEVYGIYNAAFGSSAAPVDYNNDYSSLQYVDDMMMMEEPMGVAMEEEDNLADRLESALRLVRALRSGTSGIGSA